MQRKQKYQFVQVPWREHSFSIDLWFFSSPHFCLYAFFISLGCRMWRFFVWFGRYVLMKSLFLGSLCIRLIYYVEIVTKPKKIIQENGNKSQNPPECVIYRVLCEQIDWCTYRAEQSSGWVVEHGHIRHKYMDMKQK